MMDIEIKEISFKDVKSYVKKAKKEGVSLYEFPNNVGHYWLGAFSGGKLAGMCCLLIHEKQARHCGTWVLPKYRRQCIFRRFMVERERLAAEKGAKRIFAHCLPHTWDFLRSIGYQEIDNQNGERYISKSLKG